MTDDSPARGGFVLPQTGIFAQGTAAHHFLEFDLRAGVEPIDAVASFLRLRAPEVSSGGVNVVVAYSASAWSAVAPPHLVPSGLAPFRTVEGRDGHSAPATQHDAWVWISGAAPDVTWDHARAAAHAVSDVAALADERAAFTYRDGRDMTGFVDGTANPATRAAPQVAMVPAGAPGEGGSHVLAMRWVHRLDAFQALPVADQEAVIGRTKQESIELADTVKPATAHIARVEIDDADGSELAIFRRSVPYGSVAEHGLCFVAFSGDRLRFDVMLERMFGLAEDGLRDHLTDFSRPVSGGYYFAPSLNALAEVGGAAG